MQKSFPDHDQLSRWLNEQSLPEPGAGHEDLRKILESTSHWQVPPGRSQEEAWKALQAKLEAGQEPVAALQKSRPLFRWVGAAAAIVLMIALGLWYVNLPRTEQLATQRAEKQSLELPDGSKTYLNAETELAYQEVPGDQRRISLRGEAFFDVVSGLPFVVETSQGTVTVLGTRFNVYARSDRWEVACFSGRVQVETIGLPTRVLEPGQALAWTPQSQDSASVFVFDNEKTASWQKGKFYFENAPLIDVIAVIERQFDVEVKASGLENKTYSGFFSNQNLEKALQLVCKPLGLEYSLSQNSSVSLRKAAGIDVER